MHDHRTNDISAEYILLLVPLSHRIIITCVCLPLLDRELAEGEAYTLFLFAFPNADSESSKNERMHGKDCLEMAKYRLLPLPPKFSLQ